MRNVETKRRALEKKDELVDSYKLSIMQIVWDMNITQAKAASTSTQYTGDCGKS